MAVEELLRHVHPDAVYRRVPLPEEQNALGPWREAIENYVPPDDEDQLWGELIYGAGRNGTPVAFPSGNEGDRLRALLDRNQRALDCLEEGVHRGRLQLPEECPGGNGAMLNAGLAIDVHHLVQMLWVKTKAFQADGDVLAVCRSLVEQLRIGEILCNCEGLVSDYLIGVWSRKSATNQLRALAVRDATPRPALVDMLSTVAHSIASTDGLAQSMRVELCCWVLPRIDKTPEGGELEDFVDQLLDVWYAHDSLSVEPTGEPQRVTPSDDRLAWRRRQIISLLRDHPCPYDKAATVRHLGELVAARIHSLSHLCRRRKVFDLGYRMNEVLFALRWRPCWRRPRGIGFWPAQFMPEYSVECLGPSEEARAKLAEISQYWSIRDLKPPTEADIDRYRSRLHRVHNPVGWMLLEFLFFTSVDVTGFVREHWTSLHGLHRVLTRRLGA
jgi:hypothetical protein